MSLAVISFTENAIWQYTVTVYCYYLANKEKKQEFLLSRNTFDSGYFQAVISLANGFIVRVSVKCRDSTKDRVRKRDKLRLAQFSISKSLLG